MTNLIIFLLTITNWFPITYEKPVTNSVGWTNYQGRVLTQVWARVEWREHTNQVLMDSQEAKTIRLKKRVDEVPQSHGFFITNLTQSWQLEITNWPIPAPNFRWTNGWGVQADR